MSEGRSRRAPSASRSLPRFLHDSTSLSISLSPETDFGCTAVCLQGQPRVANNHVHPLLLHHYGGRDPVKPLGTEERPIGYESVKRSHLDRRPTGDDGPTPHSSTPRALTRHRP